MKGRNYGTISPYAGISEYSLQRSSVYDSNPHLQGLSQYNLYPETNMNNNLKRSSIYHDPVTTGSINGSSLRQNLYGNRNSSLSHGLESDKFNSSRYESLHYKENHGSLNVERKLNDLTTKIDRIHISIKKHQKQITELTKNNHDMTSFKKIILEESRTINEHRQSQFSKYIDAIQQQIDVVKVELGKNTSQDNLRQELFHIQNTIRTAISNMRETISLQMNQFTENTLKQRKKDMEKIKIGIETAVQQCTNNWNKIAKQLEASIQSVKSTLSMVNPLPSMKKYPGQPFILKYCQRFQLVEEGDKENVERTNRQETGKTTYYKLDRDGYLLDDQNSYVLDLQGNQIRLLSQHLKLLKKVGVYP